MVTAFLLLFLLGAYLGRVGRSSWLGAGIRTLLIGLGTALLVLLLGLWR